MKITYKIKGLDCANCAKELEESLNKQEYINEVTINFVTQKMIINTKEKDIEKLTKNIEKIIKKEEPDVSISKDSEETNLKPRIIKIIISLMLFIIALLIPNNLIKTLLFIISYITVAHEILKKSLINILHGKIFDENFLMSLATIGAFLIGELPEAVAVMLFYQVGELFQSYAVNKSRKSISELMDIRPDYATLFIDDTEKKVNPAEVNIDDIIIVKPGEKIPLDGVLIEGETRIDTKNLTGESIPKHLDIGNNILSGCINIESPIKIKVTKKFEQSTVNKILELVENASNKKSNSENFITKFAEIYTPTVVIIAILLATIPSLFIPNTKPSIWIYRALSFLVVSCPCALVISIPLSFFGGIAAASKIGVLIKGSNYLEKLAKTEIIVCDKTGTLTEGVFKVQEINTIGISKEDFLKYASYAEYYSNHPIAQSIKKEYGKEIDDKKIKNIKEIPGRGISASINKKNILIGNEQLMNDNNIEYQENKSIGTICYLAIDNQFKGSILISDQIKKDSLKTINKLKNIGIKNIIMLTGDRESIAKHVSNKLKIDTYYAELLPNEKVSKVEELLKKKQEGNLIFIGDGINDAPVLAIADIGISMGKLGSDAAIEASDIVIMTDELSKIPMSIDISNKTLRIVKQNIIFSILVKVIVLILSALGLSTMWWAVFADVGVSIIAILNAIRILKIK